MSAPVISVLCPTRNRPDSVFRLFNSIMATAAGAVELIFYCDDDAPGSVLQTVAWPSWVKVVTGPRIVLSDMWNKCLEKASADIFMQCGDDIAFRTPGWDTAVLDAFAAHPDRIALVYGDDLIFGEKLASHGFFHRRWTEATGYLTPPWFSSDYGDAWNYDVAQMIGRLHFLPGVITEHLHPSAGKSEWDATHQERLARHAEDDPGALYESMLPAREMDAAKLRAVMT